MGASGYTQLPITPYRPEQPDILGQAGKLATLRTMGMQQQLVGGQIQQQQIALQNRAAGMKAMQQWDGKSYDGLPDLIAKNGGDFDTVQAAQNHILGIRDKYSQIAERDAKTGETNLNTQMKRNDLTAGALSNVLSQPDALIGQTLTQTATDLLKQGIIDPPHYQIASQVAQLAATDPQTARAQLESMKKGMTADSAQITQAQEQAKTKLDIVNATLAQNKADIINQYKQNPNLLSSQVDAIFPPNTAQNQRYKSGVQMALQTGDVDAAKAWITQASQEKSGLEKEAFVQGQESLRQNLNRQAMMSNELQKSGLAQIDKLFTDPARGYGQFVAQANATKTALADAKDGSQFAASLAPLMTVLGVNSFAGVHRINPAEYQAAGPQLGSVYRRINAALDKAGSGAIPAATMQEMNGLVDNLIDAKHQSLLPQAQMVARNAGLDPAKTSVMTRDGGVDTLSNVAGRSQARQPSGGQKQSGHPFFSQFGGAAIGGNTGP